MIRLRTLGTVDVQDSGGADLSAVLAQSKRVALFAYLALSAPHGPIRRDTLLALFWPEHDEEHARNALSQAIHFLRRFLGGDTLVGRGAADLLLDRQQVWCDAVAFEEALDSGRTQDAVELYRGDLLDGFHAGDLPDFDQWLTLERARLAGRYVQALEALADERTRAGELNAAAAHWRRIAARDPLSSRTALKLMRALAAAGDPAAALQHARIHETLLREELGAAPDREIAALVRQLKSSIGTPPGAPVVDVQRAPASNEDAALRAAVPASPAAADVASVAGADVSRGVGGRRWRTPVALAAVGLFGIAMLDRAWQSPDIPEPPARAPFTQPIAIEAASDESPVEQLYRRGREFELSRSPEGLQTAKAVYEEAIKLDPTFARGYAAMAGIHGFNAHYGYGPVEPELERARKLAVRAMALDSMDAEVRATYAETLGDAGGFAAAEREFQEAIRLNANSGRAHYLYSLLLVALGRGQEALEHARIAERIYGKLAPRGVLAVQRYAQFLIDGTRPERDIPIEERRQILKVDPNEPWALAREAADLAADGRCMSAGRTIARATQIVQHNFRMDAIAGVTYLSCGDEARTRNVLSAMKQRQGAYDHGYRMAIIHAALGEADSAFMWIGRHRWTMAELAGLRGTHFMDPIREDPRYPRLLEELGIAARAPAEQPPGRR